MKKILITGKSSYIGSAVSNHLSKYPNDFEITGMSLRDGTWRNSSLKEYDTVFHVSGIAHADSGKLTDEKKALYYSVNTDLTYEIAEKAKNEGVKQFIFMSSAIIYGDSAPIGKRKHINKDTPPSPSGAYGDSKLQAELKLKQLDSDDFRVVILRPPMIYGKGSKGNYPILAKLALKLPFFPKVKNERSMLYIENLAEFVRLMIKNEERGTFWPQNAEYSDTSTFSQMIAKTHGKNLKLISGFNWLLKLGANITPLINKAFGSLSYDMELSEYKENYRLFSLKESIEKTEK